MTAKTKFNLIVRHNLEQTQDDFGQSDVRLFDKSPVICGTASDCNCLLEKESREEPDQWFKIEQDKETNSFQVIPLLDGGVFFKQETTALSGKKDIISGDWLRVGHYTFRFQRVRGKIVATRKSDILATFAKILLALIFVMELGLVYWLPRKLQNSRMMAKTILSQKTMKELDALRSNIHRGQEGTPDNTLPALARAVVAEELAQQALYIRNNQKYLTSDQWQQIRFNLSRIGLLLKQADSGCLGAPLPVFDQDKAVESILERHNAIH